MFIRCFWRQESSSSMTLAWKWNCFNTTPGGVLPDMSNGIWCKAHCPQQHVTDLDFSILYWWNNLNPQAAALKDLPPPYFMGWLFWSGVINEMHSRTVICETIKIKVSILTKLFPFHYGCKNWSLLYRYNRVKSVCSA